MSGKFRRMIIIMLISISMIFLVSCGTMEVSTNVKVNKDGSSNTVFRLVYDESIKKVLDTVNIPIQIGGGIRSKERVKQLLNMGVNRVIVGSMAIKNKELLKELVNKYKEKIVVSIDVKNNKVAVEGWEELSNVNSVELCKELEKIGVKTIVYTDISKDGMLIGPNFDIYEKLSKETNLDIIASGGISSIEDIKKLKDMNLYGAIIGKALYENKIELKEVLSLC